jgi:hypothetical protein
LAMTFLFNLGFRNRRGDCRCGHRYLYGFKYLGTLDTGRD